MSALHLSAHDRGALKARALPIVLLLLAVAAVTAGCGSSAASSSSAPDEQPSPPPTTLAADAFGQPVTITRKGTTHDGDVTIDRTTGRIYISWAEDKPKPAKANFTPQDAYVAYSDDGGRTFSEPVRSNHDLGTVNAGFNTQTRIVSTGGNRLLASWPLMNDDMSAMNAMASLSTDGGKTFAQEKPVSSADGSETMEMYHALATYGKNVYAGYLDYRETVNPDMPTGINFVRSSDGGKTFGKSVRAEVSTCECCDNALAVDSKGTIFFAFRNKDQVTGKTQIRDSAVVRSFDGGKTWSDPVKLGNDMWEFNGCPEGGPELSVDDADAVHGVYWTGKPGRPGVYYTWSSDSGASFANPVAVAVDEFYPPASVDIATESDGTSWIAWDDRRTKDRKVWLARAQNGEVETLEEPLGPGVTPAIDSDGSMTALTWSDAKGLHVVVRGVAAKDGYGSGPGDADSGQEEEEGHTH